MNATRETLLRPATRRYGTATLPVSGLDVRYQSLTEREKSAYEADIYGDGSKRTDEKRREATIAAKAMLIVRCLVDEHGNRLLMDSDSDTLLNEWDGADSSFLFTVLDKHINTQSVAKLAKNSDAAPG